MSTEKIFLWFAVIGLAVVLDFATFRWTQRLWGRGRTPTMLVANSMQRFAPLARWVRARFTPASLPAPATEAPPGVAALPAGSLPEAAQVASSAVTETPLGVSREPAAVITTESKPPEPVTVFANPSAPRTAHVQISVDVPEGVTVRLTIEALPGAGVTVAEESPARPSLAQPSVAARPAPRRAAPTGTRRGFRWPGAGQSFRAAWSRLRAKWQARAVRTEVILLGTAFVTYLLTHLIGLTRFPIYFFTDEAVHMNLAADFVRDGFKNYQGEFLPTYFSLGPSFGLNSVSVYVQVLPYLLFGKSVFVTRAVSMLITALGALAVSLILKHAFRLRHAWLGILLISISPAWFLHARTAFEYIEVASFYAGFLYCYLRYRTDAPRYLYGAVALGALTFYTHGLGQVLMGLTAVLLFLVDLPYHFHPARRPVVLRALALAGLLALPYGRYALAHPSTTFEQMRQRASYWTETGFTLPQKLLQFGKEYLYGLSPSFWYFPNDRDLIRHVMKGYGHLLWPTLPFAFLGVAQAIKNFRSPTHRIILIALLASPLPAALVAIGVPRILWFIVPAAVLTALGLSVCLDWLEKQKLPVPPQILINGLFVVLVGFNVYMLADALIRGPVWYNDYTLYGLQYGAQQIFGEVIPAHLKQDPDVRIFISPSWANGTDQFLAFFLNNEQLARVQTRTVDDYLFNKQPLDHNMLFVMIPDEYRRATSDPNFKTVELEETIPYPDGSPGFYLARLEYADNVDEIFAAAEEERRKPVVEQYDLDGQTVEISHSRLDAGTLHDIFDADPFTLGRGQEANPLVFEITFPEARALSGLAAQFGSMDDFTVTVKIWGVDSSEPVVYEQNFRGLPDDPHIEIAFDRGPSPVQKVRLEIKDNLAGDRTNIHVRELSFP